MGHNDSKGGGGHGSPPLEASGQLGRGGSKKEAGPVIIEVCGWGGPTCWPSPVAAPTLPTILPPTQWSVFFTPQGQFVVQVSVGRYHTIAVTVDGSVYTWGLNDWGQLGRAAVGASSAEDPTECFSGGSCHDGAPKKVGQLEGEGAGGEAGGALGTAGRALRPPFHRKPRSNMQSAPPSPTCSGTHIVGVTSGRYNTMVLDDAGQLYVWGYDGCAEGVVPEQSSAWKARRIKGELEGQKVVAFDAGGREQ